MVAATAASSGLCAPLSPALASSTVSEPSWLSRVPFAGGFSAGFCCGLAGFEAVAAGELRFGGGRSADCLPHPAARAAAPKNRARAQALISAHSLQIRGEIAHVVRAQALGDGLHDVARPGTARARG